MSKKTFVVTGATQGIGLETARLLAEKGHKVLIVTRTEGRGNETKQNILSGMPEADVQVYFGDMSLLSEVRKIGSEILSDHTVIDGLINNVGTWMSKHVLTSEGIETVFATNHLSYFLMTHLLYPALKKSEQGRVVNVASNAHSYGKINLEDPGYSKKYHGLRSNGQSKLANIYFTFEFDKLKPDASVTTYAVSPGLVKTDIGLKHTNWLHALAWKFRRRKGRTPREGASTSVFCATEPSISSISGKYWEYGKVKEVFPSAKNEKLGEGLWLLSLAMTGIEDYFYEKV